MGEPALTGRAKSSPTGSASAPVIRPDEVYALRIAIAGTWSPVSGTYTASSEDDEAADHERRRAVLRDLVSRALVP